MAKFLVSAYEFRSARTLAAPRATTSATTTASVHEDDINRSAEAGFTAGRDGRLRAGAAGAARPDGVVPGAAAVLRAQEPAPGKRSGMEHFEIATVAEQSADFRRVLWTGEHTQLVIMTIPPGGEIGEEEPRRERPDPVVRQRHREGRRVRQEKKVKAGDIVVVPAGKKHNFVNEGPNPLVLYTVYGPPDHADGAVHKTKEQADALEEAGKDEPPSS